jgi:hypothetical protein
LVILHLHLKANRIAAFLQSRHTMRFKLRPIAIASTLWIATAHWGAVAQVTLPHSMTLVWQGSVLRVTLDQPSFQAGVEYALMIGDQDFTAIATILSEESFEIDLKGKGLSAGAQRLQILTPGEATRPRILASADLSIPASIAQPVANLAVLGVAPQTEDEGLRSSVTIGVKSRLQNSVQTTATPAIGAAAIALPRNTFVDLTTQMALQYSSRLADGQLSAQANLAGSSYQQEALRFANSGNQADKLDLASYDVQWRNDQLRVALGHLSHGNHPLLASGIGNRGLGVVWKFNPSWDVGASLQAGSSVVGFPNPSGLAQVNNRIRQMSVGWTLWPESPQRLRTELSVFSGEQTPQVQPGIGQLAETARSHGWGIRMLAATPDERGRAEWSWASSTYRAPVNNAGFVAPDDRGQASALQLSYELLRDHRFSSDSAWPLSVAAQWRNEWADRTYRSLGASVAGDYATQSLQFNGTVGAIAWQLGWNTRHDNTDGDTNLPRNLANSSQLGLNLPLAQWWGAAWPSVSYNMMRGHNRMDLARLPAGFPAFAVADLKQSQDSVELSWSTGRWTWGLRLQNVKQDNRDLSNNDTATWDRDLTWSWQAMPTLQLDGLIGRGRDFSSTTLIERQRTNAQIGANWRFGQRWAIAANWSNNADRDDQGFQTLRGANWNLQLSKQFDVVLLGNSKQNGSFWLRMNHNRNLSQGIEPLPGLQAYSTDTRSRSVQAGVSLTF